MCTDNALVATMLASVPHHEFSLQRQDPHLDPLETSCLFDVIRTIQHELRGSSSPLAERISTEICNIS